MKRSLQILSASLILVTGCTVVVRHPQPPPPIYEQLPPPPPPRVEIIPGPPFYGAVWVSGHWHRRPDRWVWVPGHYR